MTWAKVDDHANEHRKQLAAGAEACWLWTCGLMYANRQTARDGFIPDGVLGMLYPFKSPGKLAAKLIGVGLWHRVPGGYLIHEFTWWNQTREQRDAELAAGRERAAKSYAARNPKNPKSSPEEQPKTTSEESDALQNSSGSTPTPLPLPLPATPGRAGERAPAPDEQGTWDGSERETACPLDIAQRAKALGIPQKLAESLKVDLAAVDALIHDFASYWTIGGGMGQKRRHWMRKLRENVRQEAKKPGGLPAPGALEHSNLARESRIVLKEIDQVERGRLEFEAEKARRAAVNGQ